MKSKIEEKGRRGNERQNILKKGMEIRRKGEKRWNEEDIWKEKREKDGNGRNERRKKKENER